MLTPDEQKFFAATDQRGSTFSVFDSAFEEQQHPRANDGKFAKAGETRTHEELGRMGYSKWNSGNAEGRRGTGSPVTRWSKKHDAGEHVVSHAPNLNGKRNQIAGDQHYGRDGNKVGSASAPHYPERQPAEADKTYLKRIAAELPDPKELPEEHEKYFDMKGAKVVPLDQLVSTKTAEENQKGGNNAPKFMRAAYDGKVAKRAPITVAPTGDGKYKILDGNGTFTGVSAKGWKSLPVLVTGM